MKFIFIILIHFISFPLIWSEEFKCLSYQKINNSKCTKFCQLGYILQQGTPNCIEKTQCQDLHSQNSDLLTFCLSKEQQQLNEGLKEWNNECKGKIQNWISGECNTINEIKNKQLLKIGIFNSDKSAFFEERVIKKFLGKKQRNSVIPVKFSEKLKDCEIIDDLERVCIQKEICKQTKLIQSVYCKKICDTGYTQNDKECISIKKTKIPNDSINKSASLNLSCIYKQKDLKIKTCHTSCNDDQIYFDLKNGLFYCDYKRDTLENPNYQTLVIPFNPNFELKTDIDSFKIFVTEKQMKTIFKDQNHGPRIQLENTDHNNLSLYGQVGIFKIFKQDWPFVFHKGEGFLECNLNEKPIQFTNYKECIPCNRIFRGAFGCSDLCGYNQVASNDNQFCYHGFGINIFNQTTLFDTIECKLPDVLSNDEQSCLKECKTDQIPKRIDEGNHFKCIDKIFVSNPEFIVKNTDFKLSTDKTKYVEDCLEIQEISCKETQNECKKKIKENQIDPTCILTTEQAIEWLGKNNNKIILQLDKGIDFLKEEFNWFFLQSRKEELNFNQTFSLLNELISVSVQISEGISQMVINGRKQLLVADNDYQISAKIAILPDKGGLFHKTIIFEESKKPDTQIIIDDVRTASIHILSLVHFSEKFICTSEKSCFTTNFILISSRMRQNTDEENYDFEIKFNKDNKQPKDIFQHYCFIVKTRESFGYFITYQNPLGLDGDLITCKGERFVGYYYGEKINQFGFLSDTLLSPKTEQAIIDKQIRLTNDEKEIQGEGSRERSEFESEQKPVPKPVPKSDPKSDPKSEKEPNPKLQLEKESEEELEKESEEELEEGSESESESKSKSNPVPKSVKKSDPESKPVPNSESGNSLIIFVVIGGLTIVTAIILTIIFIMRKKGKNN